MLIYHSILYKNNKFKFVGIILFELIIAYISLVSITSFYKENTNLPSIFLLAVLQVLNILVYIVFRLTYRDEIFVLKKDEIHVFVTNQQANIRIFKNKISQILLFFGYQLFMCIFMALIFKLPSYQINTFLTHILVSTVLFFFIFINDVAVINQYRSSYLDGISSKVVLCSVIALFYSPSYWILLIVVIALFLATIVNLVLIMKGKVNNAQN